VEEEKKDDRTERAEPDVTAREETEEKAERAEREEQKEKWEEK